MDDLSITVLSDSVIDYCNLFNAANMTGFIYFSASHEAVINTHYYVIAVNFKGVPILCIVNMNSNKLRIAAMPYLATTTAELNIDNGYVFNMYESLYDELKYISNNIIKSISNLSAYTSGVSKYLNIDRKDLFTSTSLSELEEVLYRTVNTKDG